MTRLDLDVVTQLPGSTLTGRPGWTADSAQTTGGEVHPAGGVFR